MGKIKTGIIEANQLPDLHIGGKYTIGGIETVVRVSDETACVRCALNINCARFMVNSKKQGYHKLCAGYYRKDKTSVVFMAANKPQI